MDVAGLIGLLKDSPPAKALTHGLRTGLKDMLAYGISGSARALYAASLVDSGYQVLIVTANSEEAKKINADLEAVFLPGRTAYFPAREIMPYEVYAHSNELQNQRLAVLKRLAIGELDCVVTPVGALSASIVPADILSKAMLHFENEHSLDLNSLSEQLVSRGFERVDRVENAAQFSIRGGIVDIYPVDEKPVRIELLGKRLILLDILILQLNGRRKG